MSAGNTIRHVIAVMILTAAVIAMIVSPVPLIPLVWFAAIGIVSGVLLVLPGTIPAWISGALMVFGTEWAESLLVRQGNVFAWYAPVLIAASLAVLTYYLLRALSGRVRSVST